MSHTIQLTAEQFEALQSGQPITIEPPKPTITKWEPIEPPKPTITKWEPIEPPKPTITKWEPIEPPKPTITKWEPIGGEYTIKTALDDVVKCKSAKPFRLVGLEYQTQSQADSAAKALRSYARQLAWLAENDDGWVADWSNYDQGKYFAYIEHKSNKVKGYRNFTDQFFGIIYMSQANAEKLAQLMNDGIVEF